VSQPPQDPFALVGQVLEGQYRVDTVVGEGGCGVVYKGWHVAFEQPIAVKALKMPDVTDAQTRILVLTKFREEAKLCYVLSQASLSIVRCIGYGAIVTPTQAWAPYLVLEWLEGRPLSDELEDRRRRGAPGRSLQETLGLLAPVAAGLAYAHSQRVAHRDVKPGNLFVVADAGPAPAIKILDFGIAKVMEEDATAASAPFTKGGLASFTPYYAAPEQLDPRFGPTGPWTDVYGFALVMTEVLAGQRPIRGPDVVSVIAQATHPTKRPTPRTLGVILPDSVEAVFARALALDPKARFPEVGAFWDALSRAARLGTSGRHSDGPSVPPGWIPPHQTVPMSSMGGSHGGVQATLAMGVPVQKASSPPGPPRPASVAPQPSTPPAPIRPRRWKRWVGVLCVVALLVGAGVYAVLEYAG
jgi:serine/threonine protein kinase